MLGASRIYGAAILTAVILTASDKTAISQSAAPLMAPAFEVDPFWPKELPNNWLVGNVVGVAVDSRDNVWIMHRPNSQAGAEKTPAVLAFDPAGNLVRSFGGPGAGHDWGHQAHGIYVDYKDNVWVGFGGGLPYDPKSMGTTDNALILKFTPEGKFLLQIGRFGEGTHGSNNTMFLGNPTDVAVDPKTDEVYISDGYINRRVIVFDATTGAYKRHWGAYGKRPDDALLAAFDRNGPPRQQFDTPHCVHLANDGLLYVCDRQNERIQVFKTDGTFVKEVFIKFKSSDGQLAGGRPGDMALSGDAQQRLVYMVDMANTKIHTLRRDSLEIVASFGRRGRWAGQFESPHSLAVDSKGNLFVGETLDGRRVQKFRRTGTPQKQ